MHNFFLPPIQFIEPPHNAWPALFSSYLIDEFHSQYTPLALNTYDGCVAEKNAWL